MKVLVTGGAGFIGSHFIRFLRQERPQMEIINLDKLTYAGHLENLRDVSRDARYQFIRGDICNAALVNRCMSQVSFAVHLAAETHVDRSISNSRPFLRTNVLGTQVLLEAACKHRVKRFLYVSTDEVYGSIVTSRFDEADPLHPNSPYAASKAAADLLVQAYHVTYGLPVLIVRSSNNYGPYQYPEKALPLFITNALDRKPLPLYGDGLNVRDWMHVQDHCRALWAVLERGRVGEVYNIGAGEEHPNREVAHMLLRFLNRPRSLIRFVQDRPGHDRRYALDTHKIKRLGWHPTIRLPEGLRDTVNWYKGHEGWWRRIKDRSAAFQRYYRKQYKTV